MQNRKVVIILAWILSLSAASAAFAGHGGNSKIRVQNRRILPFDSGWKFLKDSTVFAANPGYDDSGWRSLDLPHDWSIEDLPAEPGQERIGPFSRKSPGGPSTGHTIGGVGWYRKRFILDDIGDKIVSVVFDGVYMDCEVWLNGRLLGSHPYGYTPFWFDLTPHLNPSGRENVLAVRVRNEGANSRWYSGSGIYRHVVLTVTPPVHAAQWGVAVTTPEVSKEKARIQVTAAIENATQEKVDLHVRIRIVDADSRTVAETETGVSVPGFSRTDADQSVELLHPRLWSPETPNLYFAEVEIRSDGGVVDRTIEPFGIRSVHFDAQTGFILNGEKTLLRGGCLHHDNGLLGSAAFDRAEERRVEILKANGFNAVRTSHNPPSKPFLDACDRLGMLVIDEAFDMWERPKNPRDYSRFFRSWWRRDLEAMVLRDRNHPSVILWSIGNEINERADTSGAAIAGRLAEAVHRLDSTRPVTAAICGFWDHPGMSWRDSEPAFASLDVAGYNYQWREYLPDHERFPNRIMAGTESVPMEAFENWRQAETQPWVIGDFVWTAMDYLGEAGIGNAQAVPDSINPAFGMPWPWFNAFCGDIDLCGFKKPQSYYRDVVWNRSNLEMAVHSPVPEGLTEKPSYWGWPDERQSWTWPGQEGKNLKVSVYSRGALVRLALNGNRIGEKPVSADTKWTAVFDVPFAPGTLTASAYDDGKEIASRSFNTAGSGYRVRLAPDRSLLRRNRNDLSYVSVEVLDESGVLVPDADVPIRFSIRGNGELAATGNANPSEMRSFRKPGCTTFQGRCLAILRPTGDAGTVTLKAEAEGLLPASVTVQIR
jgi:beta-galactosidase